MDATTKNADKGVPHSAPLDGGGVPHRSTLHDCKEKQGGDEGKITVVALAMTLLAVPGRGRSWSTGNDKVSEVEVEAFVT